MKDGIEHEGKESQPVKASQRGRQSFVVSGKAAKTRGPGKGALDDPAPWQKNESSFGLLKFNHNQSDSLLGRLVGRFFTGITLINKSHLHAFASNFLNVFDQIAYLRTLLLAGRRDFSRPADVPECPPPHAPWTPSDACVHRSRLCFRFPVWTASCVHQESPRKAGPASAPAFAILRAGRAPWLQSSLR